MTVRYQIRGIVQGVGFRPFTAVTAKKTGITGSVANKGSFVEIIAQGTPDAIKNFENEIRHTPPDRAVILSIEETELPSGEAPQYDAFSIAESEKESGDIFVSPDIATCDKCRAELFDPSNRRYLHPFINCTQCGPRLTILDTMPYDRERTSMRDFPMCPECSAEYHNPATRRYDAQPNCCNQCGPELYIVGKKIQGRDAVTAVRRTIMNGGIAAVKGIGGFHLCCDAKNPEAVRRLRALKHRPAKPFAVMMKSVDIADRECVLKDGQREMLTGWQKPILLLEKREDTSLCRDIAPDNSTVGVMLPYAPVQMLLFDFPDDIAMTDCLVMTSGNAHGAPICRSDDDAVQEIGGFCDIILSHNRNILLRADDSVCDWFDGKPYMIRRSRGFAPLPVSIPIRGHRQVLAIGGELKNTFCIAKDGLLYASPFVGDMADIRTMQALRESVDRMCGLLEAKPEVIVCDTHPLYNSVEIAKEIAKERKIPLIQVQHHYAHVLSCMAENGYTEPVIGISMDGTGYGADGSIWGGELLLCGPNDYIRAGYIKPFTQTGGDLSAREGWRIAAALLWDADPEHAPEICEALEICTAEEYNILRNMAQKGVNSIRSTSCGRLFDAVAAILGIRRTVSFEGEAASALMYEAEQYVAEFGEAACELHTAILENDNRLILDTTSIAAEIAARYREEHTTENRAFLAYQFHAALSVMLRDVCLKIRQDTGLTVCALSGGVFQNRLLTKMCRNQLIKAGFTVLLHSQIPPNDGGICIGQAYKAISE